MTLPRIEQQTLNGELSDVHSFYTVPPSMPHSPFLPFLSPFDSDSLSAMPSVCGSCEGLRTAGALIHGLEGSFSPTPLMDSTIPFHRMGNFHNSGSSRRCEDTPQIPDHRDRVLQAVQCVGGSCNFYLQVPLGFLGPLQKLKPILLMLCEIGRIHRICSYPFGPH